MRKASLPYVVFDKSNQWSWDYGYLHGPLKWGDRRGLPPSNTSGGHPCYWPLLENAKQPPWSHHWPRPWLKIMKFVATKCQILRLKCTKSFVGWGSAPDPAYIVYILYTYMFCVISPWPLLLQNRSSAHAVVHSELQSMNWVDLLIDWLIAAEKNVSELNGLSQPMAIYQHAYLRTGFSLASEPQGHTLTFNLAKNFGLNFGRKLGLSLVTWSSYENFGPGLDLALRPQFFLTLVV